MTEAAIETTEFMVKNTRLPITISVGVTEAQDADATAEDVLNRADQALYAAKKAGRNWVAMK